jgi:hypothetical protein
MKLTFDPDTRLVVRLRPESVGPGDTWAEKDVRSDIVKWNVELPGPMVDVSLLVNVNVVKSGNVTVVRFEANEKLPEPLAVTPPDPV